MIILGNISKKVAYLKNKYHTCNPFSLANALGILVIYEELGQIKGYYNKQLRMKQIHINNNLNELDSIFTCAHELGHALLHPNENTQFLMSHTYFSVDKLEMQANQFALELLLAPDVSEMYSEYTMKQLSRFLEVNNLLSQF